MFIKLLNYEISLMKNMDKTVGLFTIRFYNDKVANTTFVEIFGGYLIVSRINKVPESHTRTQDHSS